MQILEEEERTLADFKLMEIRKFLVVKFKAESDEEN